MKNNSLVIIIAVAIVVGAVGFIGGMKYQQSQPTVGNNLGQSQNGRQLGNFQRRTGGANGLRPVMGTVLSVDSSSLTVKLEDGSSKIVLLPNTVVVNKTDTGSVSDLKVGSTVGVFGTTNSDGSVTAQNVSLNPVFRNASGSGLPRQSN